MAEALNENLAGVSASRSGIQSGIQFYDGITTGEIQEILVRSAPDLIDLESPNYQFVATRLLLFGLYKQVFGPEWNQGFPILDHVKGGIRKIYDKTLARNAYTAENGTRLILGLIMGAISCSLMQVYVKSVNYLVQDKLRRTLRDATIYVHVNFCNYFSRNIP